MPQAPRVRQTRRAPHGAHLLQVRPGVLRLARGAPRDRVRGLRRRVQEAHRKARDELVRGCRPGALLRLDRRPRERDRRGQVHAALHAAPAGQQLEQDQHRQGREAHGGGSDAGGRAEGVRSPQGGPFRRVLVRTERGAPRGVRAAHPREPGRLGLLGGPPAGLSPDRGPLGHERQARGDARAAAEPVDRGLRRRAAHQAAAPLMSRFENPCIVTCSISGAVASREQCPTIPYTPEEYAAEARRAVDEGASQIHIHARTPDGTPSYEIEDFRAITEAILAEVDDVIVNYSTGAIGVPIEKRIEYLRELRPDVAALNISSMNYAKYSARRKEFVFKAVFENSFDTIIEFLKVMTELGIRPEHECFDSGHVANLDPLMDMGLLSEPLQIDCVMGVNGGIRPTPKNLVHMADQIPGGAEGPNNWGVIGISRDQWRLVAAAAALGGNVRVGLEDNFYLPDGEMARSNGDLIARARRMVEDTGRRVASVAEARERLGTPKR